jgi:hypothetical protein
MSRNHTGIRFSHLLFDKMEIVSAAVPRAAAGAADVRLPRHTEGPGVHTPRPTEAHHPGLCFLLSYMQVFKPIEMVYQLIFLTYQPTLEQISNLGKVKKDLRRADTKHSKAQSDLK